MARTHARYILGVDEQHIAEVNAAAKFSTSEIATIEIQSLDSMEMCYWRRQAFGDEMPWTPTLVATDGIEMRAWIGLPMIARLTKILGPSEVWRIANLVAQRLDRSNPADSLNRRSLIGQGAVGLAALTAILSGRDSSMRPSSAVAAPSMTSMGNVALLAQNDHAYEIDKLKNSDFNKMKDRAEDDRNFGIIRDYFSDQRKWTQKGRDGYRVLRRKKRERHFHNYLQESWRARVGTCCLRTRGQWQGMERSLPLARIRPPLYREVLCEERQSSARSGWPC